MWYGTTVYDIVSTHYCMSLPYISTCVPSTDVGIVWSMSPMEGTYVEMYGRDIDVDQTIPTSVEGTHVEMYGRDM